MLNDLTLGHSQTSWLSGGSILTRMQGGDDTSAIGMHEKLTHTSGWNLMKNKGGLQVSFYLLAPECGYGNHDKNVSVVAKPADRI